MRNLNLKSMNEGEGAARVFHEIYRKAIGNPHLHPEQGVRLAPHEHEAID